MTPDVTICCCVVDPLIEIDWLSPVDATMMLWVVKLIAEVGVPKTLVAVVPTERLEGTLEGVTGHASSSSMKSLDFRMRLSHHLSMTDLDVPPIQIFDT